MSAKQRKRKRSIKRSARPELSAQEVRFCRLFIDLKNATEAADQAGFKSTDRVALATRASALLRKPQIAACIRRMQHEAADAEQITVNRLARSLGWQAFAKRTQIFDSNGRVKPPNKWPEELQAIVVGFDVEETKEVETKKDADTGAETTVETVTTTYKVKFERSSDAKKLLAQWLGMVGGELTLKDVKTGDVIIENDSDKGTGNESSDG